MGVFLESLQITHKRLYIMHNMPLIITNMNIVLHCQHYHKWCKIPYNTKISALMFILVYSYQLHVKHTISFPQIFNLWNIPYRLLVDGIRVSSQNYRWHFTHVGNSMYKYYENPSHLHVVDQYLRRLGNKTCPDEAPPSLESFYPPWVTGVIYHNQGVVDSLLVHQ